MFPCVGVGIAGPQKKKRSNTLGGISTHKPRKDAPKRKKIDRVKYPHLTGDLAVFYKCCRNILKTESCYANEDEEHFRKQYYLLQKQIRPDHDVYAPGITERLPQTPPFGIYMHIFTMKKVKVRMSLTDFQVDLLHHMMVAPRNFTRVDGALGAAMRLCAPSSGGLPPSPYSSTSLRLPIPRGMVGYGMVTLRTAFPVFKAFADPYKDFKDQFFRVAPTTPPIGGLRWDRVRERVHASY